MRGFSSLRTDLCSRCRLRSNLCYCSGIQPQETKTKVTVVMHAAERDRVSSGARLLEIMLRNSQIMQVGLPDNPFRGLPPAEPGYKQVLLFPDESAPLLSAEYCESSDAKIELVVPDGTWSQARRILQCNESLYMLPKVRIQEAQTNYRLRRNVHAGTLCTAEAIAYALGVTEGPEIKDRILAVFKDMSDRILWGRRSVKPYPLKPAA